MFNNSLSSENRPVHRLRQRLPPRQQSAVKNSLPVERRAVDHTAHSDVIESPLHPWPARGASGPGKRGKRSGGFDEELASPGIFSNSVFM